jgi:23S rRNA-/tRNA-specific pseudouridylate synthase
MCVKEREVSPSSHNLFLFGTDNRVAPHVLTPPGKDVEGALDLPVFVHRLDRVTSGLLVLAKTQQAAVHLSGQFADRRVSKHYTAVLESVPPSSQGKIIDSAIDGKSAITEWREVRRVQTTKGVICIVEFMPLTGRKHQLRRHAAEVLGCPIVGDELYGSTIGGKRLLLCANEIRIHHPDDDDRIIHESIVLPPRFGKFISREEKRYASYERWMLSAQED